MIALQYKCLGHVRVISKEYTNRGVVGSATSRKGSAAGPKVTLIIGESAMMTL